MASVVLKQLDKKYSNGVRAVRSLSLEVADGELVVLVGPSGCGKTTTLRLVAGLEESTAGDIYIADRLVNRIAPGNRDVAMVFQSDALYPHMSVYENMAFALKIRRTPRAEIDRRIREAAEILSLGALLDRRPLELSGGQRQRVALGRTIVREPKVFLFDEPLSHLDAHLRVQMRTEISHLHRRLATTILYVTHDQDEAMTLGQRIVVMDHGEVQQIDTPLHVYRRPANRFVASFMGSPAMNFIPGRVTDGVFQFSCPGNHQPTCRVEFGSVRDGPAELGVRPEDLVLSGEGPSLGSVVLDLVEHLGHETIAHFALAGGKHAARFPATEPIAPGDRLPLGIRPGTAHLFCADDGRRLN